MQPGGEMLEVHAPLGLGGVNPNPARRQDFIQYSRGQG